MGMFTAYFDAAGNSVDQPFVVVAGYIANYYQWRLFENSWAAIHQQHDVQLPFHMSEFMAANVRPEYAKQKNARKDYVEIAKNPKRADEFFKHICIAQLGMVNCGMSCIVTLDDYKSLSVISDLMQVIPPYALGARVCMAQVHKWELEFDVQEPVECIFEEGDFGQGKFTELIVSEGGEVPIFKPKAKFAGLQAADMYAWEQFFHLKHELLKSQIPLRGEFVQLLNAIPKMHLQTTREGLIKLCEKKGIAVRAAAP
jgi:hypothetical protein